MAAIMCDQTRLPIRVRLLNFMSASRDDGSLLILLCADMTGGVFCCLSDVIRTEIDPFDLDLGIESVQVIPWQPHRVSQDCFLAEPTHPRSQEPPADSSRQFAVHDD